MSLSYRKTVGSRPADRRWVWVLINQLAFPGMGTIMAGRKTGYLQAGVMVAGFCLFMAFMAFLFRSLIQFASNPNVTEEELLAACQPHAWLAWVGLGLCAFSWVWALLSSIGILRRPPSSSSLPPPPLPQPDSSRHP